MQLKAHTTMCEAAIALERQWLLSNSDCATQATQLMRARQIQAKCLKPLP